MENERFDAAVRSLGHGATRRGILGLLAGLTGLGLSEVTGKSRRRMQGRKRRQSALGLQAVAAAKEPKVQLCHHDLTTDTWRPITVSGRARQVHLGHGDFTYDPNAQGINQCCADTDCAPSATCIFGDFGTGTITGGCSCQRPGTCCGNPIECSLLCCGGRFASGVPGCLDSGCVS